MLCNITQNAMGQVGGYPARSSQGGTLARGVPWLGGYPGWGGTLAGGYPGWGVPWLGGTLGGTLAGGVPCRGGTHIGQHREYLLHGRRYASCIHAGGLSCCWVFFCENVEYFYFSILSGYFLQILQKYFVIWIVLFEEDKVKLPFSTG